MLPRLAFLTPLLTAALAAQTSPSLIGASVSPAALALGSTRHDFLTCAPRTCATGLGLPAAAPAGGTAYDASARGVWHTDGVRLGLYDAATCAQLCAPISLTPYLASSLATGLACDESTNRLFVSDSSNAIHTFTLGCPPAYSGKCQVTGLPTGSVVAGLATSDLRQLLFYSVSSFSSASPSNTIHVARIGSGSPCAPFCSFAVDGCETQSLGPITGLAYDDHKRRLWATDGLACVAFSVDTTGCTAVPTGCCAPPVSDRLVGLCILPSQPTSLGPVCTGAPCPSCPSLVHATLGDPALGNASFALTLQNAPANAGAVLALGPGTCATPGLTIGIFCAPLLVPVPGLVTIGLATGGTTGCTGGLSLPLPIPADPSLFGIPLSSQFFVACIGGTGFGSAVTNCLSLSLIHI